MTKVTSDYHIQMCKDSSVKLVRSDMVKTQKKSLGLEEIPTQTFFSITDMWLYRIELQELEVQIHCLQQHKS